MLRLARPLLVSALFAVATAAQAGPPDFVPPGPPAATPVGSSFGLSVADSVRNNGSNLGSVPEPETWAFTLAGLLAGMLLRRRRR